MKLLPARVGQGWAVPAFLLSLVLSLAAHAATKTWNNASGGSWTNASNWTPAGAPGNGDTANLTLAGTYTVSLDGNATLAALTVGGAGATVTLTNTAATLVVTNGSVKSGSRLGLGGGDLRGRLTVETGGTLALGGSGTKNFYQCTLINHGTVRWSGGELRGGHTPTTVITNSGLWEITSDNTFNQGIGGPDLRFHNRPTGILRKSSGTGTSGFSNFLFENLGLVDVQTGTLQFSSQGGSVLGGNFSIATGATLTLASGSYTGAGGVFSGAGTRQMTGGTLTLTNDRLAGLRLAGGTVLTTGTFQQSGAITNLLIEGATLDGTNRVGSGTLTLTAGDLRGLLTVEAGGTLELTNSATKNFYQCTLINQGTVRWSGGELRGGHTPTTVITNSGLWVITSDNSFNQGIGGPDLRFHNRPTGILRKSAGTGTSAFSNFLFENLGLVDVQTGTLQFSSQGGSVLGGTFTASAGATLTLASGSYTGAGGVFSGAGTRQMTGGTLTLPTDRLLGLKIVGGTVLTTGTFQQGGAITNLVIEGGGLSGTNRVGQGTLTVTSGDLRGQLTVEAGGVLDLTSSATKNFYQFTLINHGTVRWSGGELRGGHTPTTVITNSGLWEITSDNTFNQGIGGPDLRFHNRPTGILRKSAGTGTSAFSNFLFENLGLVDVQTGTLQFSSQGGSVLGGNFSIATSATLTLASGSYTGAGGVFSGAGTRQMTGGTLTLPTDRLSGLKLAGGTVLTTGTFQQAGAITNLLIEGATLSGTNRVGSGTLTLTAGDLRGLLTVEAGGTLELTNSATKNFYQCTLINQGTVRWSGGELRGGHTPTTVITNSGLWVITSDNTFNQGIGGPDLRFHNRPTGILRKSAGTGTSAFSNFLFENLGLVDVQTGTLQFSSQGGSVLGGNFSIATGATLTLASGSYTGAGGVFSGAGTRQMTGGTLTLPTDRLSGLKLAGGTVLTTGTFQQAGAITNLLIEGATLSGTNRVGPGTLTVSSGDLRGVLTVEASGALDLIGSGTKNFYQCTLINQGTVRWSGGELRGGHTPTTIITNSGLWEITSDNTFNQGIGGPDLRFHNRPTGILRKSAGTGISAFSSFLFENLGLIEALNGTLTLPPASTNATGTLRVGTNSLLQTSDGFAVLGGRVEGVGSIRLKSVAGGVVAPGLPTVGRLTATAGLQLAPGVTAVFDVAGTASGTNADQIRVTGTVNLNNAVLSLPDVTGMPVGSQVVLIDNDGTDAVVGTFGGLPNGALFTADQQLFRVWYDRGTGNDVVLVRDNGGVLLTAKTFGTGEYLFQGRGTNFATYTIYATTNLAAPISWTVIGSTVADPSGLFEFKDTNAFRYPMRFYKSLGP